jgi:tRNA uridine 5-carboxymethylaminomethyl modification enzyme
VIAASSGVLAASLQRGFGVIVIGGGHAGIEAAWAAASVLASSSPVPDGGERPECVPHELRVALVTPAPGKIGVMSCNPAIGGLAKGQMVREIDALGGLMGLITDTTGIQFKVLNTSKGAAVHGPRAQCDKHAYAREAQRLLATSTRITIVSASVEGLIVERGGAAAGGERYTAGVRVRLTAALAAHGSASALGPGCACELHAPAIVLTTGTFMRGLMHTGESQTPGGRFGEHAAHAISANLRELGFELGRLKTGTPPRLKRSTINWESLERQDGDEAPTPFSELACAAVPASGVASACAAAGGVLGPLAARFPVLPQVDCRITTTGPAAHTLIRANLHRAPMYSGQIASAGPRYCPSIEDKVVRFADKPAHQVYLEPESLSDDWVYCNGISTSLPADVQEGIVRSLPGCERAEIYRHGYAVEYDMVRPHQTSATCESKLVQGLFLAGQINGTSGYEEAAAQGVIAGMNAARASLGLPRVTLGRDEAYAGVLMDDLATKTPIEPYRMFTSRAEHRLLLRADNAPDRLTPVAHRLGLLEGTPLGRARAAIHAHRADEAGRLDALINAARLDGRPLAEHLRNPDFTTQRLRDALWAQFGAAAGGFSPAALAKAHTDRFYEPYAQKAMAQIRRHAELERRRIPRDFDYATIASIRTEARVALQRFRPETLGQASRLEGLTPADVVLLGVLVRKHRQQSV